MSDLVDQVRRLEYEAQDNAKTAVDFMQKNEALRAENAKLRERIADIENKNMHALNSMCDYYCENYALQTELDNVNEEYTNRGTIIQDFAKREHELQKLVGELEKQIGHMGEIIGEFFPPPTIPAPWDAKPVESIPQGEWVLRSNEALRNRVVELGRECEIRELTTKKWKSIYERQMAVNARQRSRLAELRLQLKRITIERIGGTATMARMAQMALDADDKMVGAEYSDIITIPKEAP